MTASSSPVKEGDRDFFDVVGSFGPFQKKIFALFFTVNVVGVWQNFAITFLAPNMDFRCDANNATSDQCHYTSANASSSHNGSTAAIPCDKWHYDLSFYQETIVSQWDLVCDREWLISLSKSVYMIGFLISVIFFGQMADWVGRYPTVVVCYVITLVSGLMSIFSQSYLMFVILRFFQAFGRTGLTTTGFVLMTEVTGPDKRDAIGIAIQLGWTVGLVTLPALAWFVRSWIWLQVAMVVPFVPLVCICCLVPESPRWLKARGEAKKFEKVVSKACEQNDPTSAEANVANLMTNFENVEEKKNKSSIVDLVRTPQMRKRILCMAYLWFVNAYVYYSLAYNTNDLGGNPYLNFFLSSVIEFPSYLTLYFSIRSVGRRASLIVGMLVCGASCAAIMVVPPDVEWLVVTFAMIGKFFVNGTFGLLYLYTTEMFPTVVRNIAVGSCSTTARVGSILAPFARELGQYTHYTLPNSLNAVLAISSGVVAILLPETKGIKVPDTLDEGENMGAAKSFKGIKLKSLFKSNSEATST